MIPGLGSFSGSGSYSGYRGYPNQNYGNQGYPNQNYGGQGWPNQNYPDQGSYAQNQTAQQGYQQNPSGGQGAFQPNMPAQTSGGQCVCSGRFKILSVVRGKDDFQCRVLRELREAAAPGREILS